MHLRRCHFISLEEEFCIYIYVLTYFVQHRPSSDIPDLFLSSRRIWNPHGDVVYTLLRRAFFHKTTMQPDFKIITSFDSFRTLLMH